MSLEINLEEITSDRGYATVSFLVDNDRFLEEVVKARKLIGLDSPLEYDEAKKWLNSGPKNVSLLKMNKSDKEAFRKRFQLVNRVHEIKQQFRKGINFTYIITYAIIAGKVTDKEITSSAFCEPYPFSREFESLEVYIEEPMVAIFINPETMIDEIKKLMSSEVEELFKKAKRYNMVSRTSQNIRRDREWYWMNKQGLSYGKIWEKLSKMERTHDVNGIAKAIQQYKKNLVYK